MILTAVSISILTGLYVADAHAQTFSIVTELGNTFPIEVLPSGGGGDGDGTGLGSSSQVTESLKTSLSLNSRIVTVDNGQDIVVFDPHMRDGLSGTHELLEPYMDVPAGTKAVYFVSGDSTYMEKDLSFDSLVGGGGSGKLTSRNQDILIHNGNPSHNFSNALVSSYQCVFVYQTTVIASNVTYDTKRFKNCGYDRPNLNVCPSDITVPRVYGPNNWQMTPYVYAGCRLVTTGTFYNTVDIQGKGVSTLKLTPVTDSQKFVLWGTLSPGTEISLVKSVSWPPSLDSTKRTIYDHTGPESSSPNSIRLNSKSLDSLEIVHNMMYDIQSTNRITSPSGKVIELQCHAILNLHPEFNFTKGSDGSLRMDFMHKGHLDTTDYDRYDAYDWCAGDRVYEYTHLRDFFGNIGAREFQRFGVDPTVRPMNVKPGWPEEDISLQIHETTKGYTVTESYDSGRFYRVFNVEGRVGYLDGDKSFLLINSTGGKSTINAVGSLRPVFGFSGNHINTVYEFVNGEQTLAFGITDNRGNARINESGNFRADFTNDIQVKMYETGVEKYAMGSDNKTGFGKKYNIAGFAGEMIIRDSVNDRVFGIGNSKNIVYDTTYYVKTPIGTDVTIDGVHLEGNSTTVLSLPYLSGNYTVGDSVYVPIIPKFKTVVYTVNGEQIRQDYSNILGAPQLHLTEPVTVHTVVTKDSAVTSGKATAVTSAFAIATEDGTMNAIFTETGSGSIEITNRYVMNTFTLPPPKPLIYDPLKLSVDVYVNNEYVKTSPVLGVDDNPVSESSSTFDNNMIYRSVKYAYGNVTFPDGVISIPVEAGDFVEFHIRT